MGTQIEEFEVETVIDLLHLASDLGDVLLEGVVGLESSKLLFDSLESVKVGCYVAGTLLKLFDAGSQKTSGELSLLLEIVYGERRGESKAKKETKNASSEATNGALDGDSTDGTDGSGLFPSDGGGGELPDGGAGYVGETEHGDDGDEMECMRVKK